MRTTELEAMIHALIEASEDHPFGGNNTVLIDVKKESFLFICNQMLTLLSKMKVSDI